MAQAVPSTPNIPEPTPVATVVLEYPTPELQSTGEDPPSVDEILSRIFQLPNAPNDGSGHWVYYGPECPNGFDNCATLTSEPEYSSFVGASERHTGEGLGAAPHVHVYCRDNRLDLSFYDTGEWSKGEGIGIFVRYDAPQSRDNPAWVFSGEWFQDNSEVLPELKDAAEIIEFFGAANYEGQDLVVEFTDGWTTRELFFRTAGFLNNIERLHCYGPSTQSQATGGELPAGLTPDEAAIFQGAIDACTGPEARRYLLEIMEQWAALTRMSISLENAFADFPVDGPPPVNDPEWRAAVNDAVLTMESIAEGIGSAGPPPSGLNELGPHIEQIVGGLWEAASAFQLVLDTSDAGHLPSAGDSFIGIFGSGLSAFAVLQGGLQLMQAPDFR